MTYDTSSADRPTASSLAATGAKTVRDAVQIHDTTQAAMTDADAILLDIEGTTTSIAFVYDTLFPYARRNLRRFLDSIAEEEGARAAAVDEIVAGLRTQAEADRDEGLDAPQIPPGSVVDGEVRDAVERNVLWQMDQDRKTTALKRLQGIIWESGYRDGTLRGHVYDDVLPALERWREAGTPVYIYSSGSVAAQKLLFGASEAGDLLPYIAGHFDTTTGPKKEAASYRKIADAIDVEPSDVLFVTDNLDEARAADEAGMRVAVSVRPGNPAVGEHGFDEVRAFGGLG